MTTTSGVTQTQQNQTVTPNTTVTDSNKTVPSDSDFDKVLRGLLTPDKENKVSEEELFAGILKERITKLKGNEAGAKYQELLEKNKEALKKPDGFIPFEDAANKTLDQLTKDGVLSASERQSVFVQAFNAAQLDDNKSILWDSRGGKGDPTVALALMDSAISSAQTMCRQFDSGEIDPSKLTIGGDIGPAEVRPNGNKFDSGTEFLFKPISNNEKRAAVILPSKLAHMVDSVVLQDANGNEIDRGNSTGYGDTGLREKFAFSKAGPDYTKDLRVVVTLLDGSTKTYFIPDPGQRYE